MPCEPFKIKNEDGSFIIGIMCSRGRNSKPCYVCGKPHTSLCDYSLGNGKTCDKPMCNSCKTRIGHDLDVCREHSNPAAVAKTRGW
jgi:hypothetical protein